MFRGPSHLSDRQLLLAADCELSARQLKRVERHLAACETCRVRLDKIRHAMEDVAGLQNNPASLPAADGPRALLKARLTQAATAEPHQQAVRLRTFFGEARWALVCIALSVVLAGALGIWRGSRSRMQDSDSAAELNSLPDTTLTPGATLSVTRADVCRETGDQETHPIPPSLRRKVLEAYRAPESPTAEYEVDFLITPGLGGADDVRNLWPEPYSSTVWNAHVKDELEDRLHAMVCAGDIDLATAQHDIAKNWISAYKKYFHTDTPLSGGLAHVAMIYRPPLRRSFRLVHLRLPVGMSESRGSDL